MKHIPLNAVGSVYSHQEYIVALGKDVSILRTNGDLLVRRTDLKNPYKTAFITDNLVLVECCKQKEYVVLSLCDGQSVACIKMPPIDLSRPQFLVSPDGKHVYDLGWVRGNMVLIHIDIHNQEASVIKLDMGLRATIDMKFDHRGVLCLLQEQQEMIGEKVVNLCGVRYEYFDPAFGIGCAYYWKSKCQFEHPQEAIAFGGDTHTIITSDWKLFDTEQNIATPWFALDSALDIPDHIHHYQQSPDGRYAVMTNTSQILVVDNQNQQLVARYYTKCKIGCIVGDTFWLPTENEIVIKPFPLIEMGYKTGDGSLVSLRKDTVVD